MVEPSHLIDPPSVPGYIWPLIVAGISLIFLATTDGQTLFVTVPLTAGLLVSAGFLWVLWQGEKRGWHDFVARTWVVHE